MAMSTDAARAGMRSVTRGTLVMIVGTLGLVAETFISRVLLTRWLTNEEWNAFSLGLALAGLLAALGSLGFASAVARNLPFVRSDDERRGLVRASVRFLVPVSVATGGALALLSLLLAERFGAPLLAVAVAFFGISVTLSILTALLASYFQGFEDALPNALFNQVLTPGLFIFFLLAAWGTAGFHLSLTTALAGYVGSAAASFLLLLAFTQRRLPRLLPRGPVAPGVGRRLFLFALPLLVVGVLSTVSGSADTLLLGYFHGGSVGLYSNQLSLARLLQVGVGSLGYIFLPVAARLVRERAAPALRLTYATATKWTLLTSLPLFLLFFFLPTASMGFVFGARYASSPLSLEVLVTGAFFGCILGPASTAQISYGQTRLLMYNTVAAAVANVLLSLLLIPSYGPAGAAVAWAAASALYPALSTLQLVALDKVHPFLKGYLVPLAATLVPLGVLFALLPRGLPGWTLPLLGLAAAGWFVLAVLGTRSVGPGDALLLESVERLLGIRLPRLRRLGLWGTGRGGGGGAA